MGERLRRPMDRLGRGRTENSTMSSYVLRPQRWSDGWGPAFVAGAAYLALCVAYVIVTIA